MKMMIGILDDPQFKYCPQEFGIAEWDGIPTTVKKGNNDNIIYINIYTYDHPLGLRFRIFSQAHMLMEILYGDITYRTFFRNNKQDRYLVPRYVPMTSNGK
jgi:hypothetical protein